MRPSRRDRLAAKFVEAECEKVDRLAELLLRYAARVDAEQRRQGDARGGMRSIRCCSHSSGGRGQGRARE